ncbi:MAG: glycosyltransferase [Verrucomicrobiota bacterium]|nr:glycosyltransferase [Verrucomicrobiota bacterium]
MHHFLASFSATDFLQMLADHWISEFRDLGDWPRGTFESIAEYIDLFPLVVCLIWSIYGVICLLGSFRRKRIPPTLPSYSVIIPFYSEPAGALKSAQSLAEVDPPPEEILLVDDGSPDAEECAHVLRAAVLPARARLVRLPRNVGKAAALNAALREVRAEIVVCLDADTVVQTKSWHRMLARFAHAPGVGGVTGKIWPRQPHSLVEMMQTLDYLAVIGLVKNAENRWGGLMTVSGAWVAFRRQALLDIGCWNEETAAEDIDLSWRMQAAGWRMLYDRTWIAFVEMVPTWRALWRQRRRWSRGLGHAVRDHFPDALRSGATHLPVALMTLLGASWLWASLTVGLIRLGVIAKHLLRGQTVAHPAIFSRALVYVGICLAFFLLQLVIATLLDRARWSVYPKLFLLAPFYTFYFWAISLTTFVVGFPEGFLRRDRGRWRRTVRSAELLTGAHAELQ